MSEIESKAEEPKEVKPARQFLNRKIVRVILIVLAIIAVLYFGKKFIKI